MEGTMSEIVKTKVVEMEAESGLEDLFPAIRVQWVIDYQMIRVQLHRGRYWEAVKIIEAIDSDLAFVSHAYQVFLDRHAAVAAYRDTEALRDQAEQLDFLAQQADRRGENA